MPPLAPCPWCKQVPAVEHELDGTKYVACKTKACPVGPITLGYQFEHQAVAAWNVWQLPAMPSLMPWQKGRI